MKEQKEVLTQKVTKRKEQNTKLKSQITEADYELEQLQFKLRQEQARLRETQLKIEKSERHMSQVRHKSKVKSMMEMQVEGNLVSDDDDEEEKDSSFDESRSLSKEQELTAKRKEQYRTGSRKKLQQHSKTIIEMVDDNDDVSSDEFLDHPGSLPRNSFGYDQSDYEPIMRNSSLTLESAVTKSNNNHKGKKSIKKGALNQKTDRTCASSCCEDTKCILF